MDYSARLLSERKFKIYMVEPHMEAGEKLGRRNYERNA